MQVSFNTNIWIFSVGRGNAIFLKSGLNQGFIIDMGSSDDFSPAEFVEDNLIMTLDNYKECKIAQAVLSHPHTDHIAECEKLKKDKPLYPSLLTCPNDKLQSPREERIDWDRLGGSDPEKIELIETYKNLYEDRGVPLQTIHFESERTIPNLEYGIFYLQSKICNLLHQADDNKYGNALSILFYYRHGQNSILISGDITPEAIDIIINENHGVEKRYTFFDRSQSEGNPKWYCETQDQPSLYNLLSSRGLSILVAPHHGLESCYSSELMKIIKGNPQLNIISDRKIKRENDGTVDGRYNYINGASGLQVNVEGTLGRERSLSTSDGYHILIVFTGSSIPRVYADRDPKKLLSYSK